MKALIAVGDNPKSVVKFGDKWFVEFAGIFEDTPERWRSFSPRDGCATKEEAEALLENDAELIRTYE